MNESFSAHTSIFRQPTTYTVYASGFTFCACMFFWNHLKSIVNTFLFHYRRRVRIVHCDMSKCLWLMSNKNKTMGVVQRQAQNITSLSLKMLWVTKSFWMLCKWLLSHPSVIKVSSCDRRSRYTNRTLGIVIQSSKCVCILQTYTSGV